MPGVLQRGAVERPGGPQRHRSGQRDQDPLPSGEPVAGEQRQRDGQVAERDEEHQRQDQPAAQVGGLVAGLEGRRGGLDQAGRVPRVLDRRDHRLHRDVLRRGHRRPLGREVDRRDDAGSDPGELLLHPRRARGAGHAADRQLDRVRRGQRGHRRHIEHRASPVRPPIIEPGVRAGPARRAGTCELFSLVATRRKAHQQTTSGYTIRVVIKGSNKTLMSHAAPGERPPHDSRQQLR